MRAPIERLSLEALRKTIDTNMGSNKPAGTYKYELARRYVELNGKIEYNPSHIESYLEDFFFREIAMAEEYIKAVINEQPGIVEKTHNTLLRQARGLPKDKSQQLTKWINQFEDPSEDVRKSTASSNNSTASVSMEDEKGVGNINIVEDDESVEEPKVIVSRPPKPNLNNRPIAIQYVEIHSKKEELGYHYLGLENDPKKIEFNPDHIGQYLIHWREDVVNVDTFIVEALKKDTYRVVKQIPLLEPELRNKLFELILKHETELLEAMKQKDPTILSDQEAEKNIQMRLQDMNLFLATIKFIVSIYGFKNQGLGDYISVACKQNQAVLKHSFSLMEGAKDFMEALLKPGIFEMSDTDILTDICHHLIRSDRKTNFSKVTALIFNEGFNASDEGQDKTLSGLKSKNREKALLVLKNLAAIFNQPVDEQSSPTIPAAALPEKESEPKLGHESQTGLTAKQEDVIPDSPQITLPEIKVNENVTIDDFNIEYKMTLLESNIDTKKLQRWSQHSYFVKILQIELEVLTTNIKSLAKLPSAEEKNRWKHHSEFYTKLLSDPITSENVSSLSKTITTLNDSIRDYNRKINGKNINLDDMIPLVIWQPKTVVLSNTTLIDDEWDDGAHILTPTETVSAAESFKKTQTEIVGFFQELGKKLESKQTNKTLLENIEQGRGGQKKSSPSVGDWFAKTLKNIAPKPKPSESTSSTTPKK